MSSKVVPTQADNLGTCYKVTRYAFHFVNVYVRDQEPHTSLSSTTKSKQCSKCIAFLASMASLEFGVQYRWANFKSEQTQVKDAMVSKTKTSGTLMLSILRCDRID